MSQRLVKIMLPAVMLLATACRGDGLFKKQGSSTNTRASETIVDAQVIADAAGSIQAVVKTGNPNSQLVRSSMLSLIAGATVKFLPGAFPVDMTVTLEIGASLVSGSALETAGLSQYTIVAAGEPVNLFWAEDRDALVPFIVSISGPQRSQRSLQSEDILHVIYSANIVDSNLDAVGSITGADLQITDGFVSFSRQSFGTYQAILLSQGPMPRPTGAKTATNQSTDTDTDEDGDTNRPSTPNPDKQNPQTFKITAPSDPLNGRNILVKWDASLYATSYDVIIAKDADCSVEAVVTKGVTGKRLATRAIADGPNFVCVHANNQYGVTPASNNALEFLADVQTPEKPASPMMVRAGDIEIQVSWSTVEDLGVAGFARYGLEITTAIGKSLGKADVFNSELSASENQKSAIGFIGETYYARVRGIDRVGNEGPWSEWSEPLTLTGSR